MKCWICGKEENNAEVNINVDRLIGAVQEHFENVHSLKMACKKPSWKWTQEERETYNRCYRNEYGSNNAVSNLAAILGTDWQRFYTIARLARKWEQKRKWQYCFPAQDNAKRIIEYLTAPDKSFSSEINYIHWKINKAAMKKAA